MKRYLKHIFLSLTLCVLAASCMEELDSPQPAPGSDALTLVPRVTSFANRYVTKAGYGTDETKITSLAVLVFNEDGDLVHIQEGSNTGGISTLTLNKSMLNSPEQDGKLDNATLVMIANAGLDTIKAADGKSISDNRSDLTLDGLNAYTFHFEEGQTVVTSLGDGFTGFPMIGTATADLTPTSSVQSAIEVKLQILYAKVNFSITVAEGGENQNLVDPKFTLSGYTVNNVSMRTSYAAPAEGAATASDEYAYTEAGFSGNTAGTATMNGTPVTFTFYVAESRYEHGSDLKGIYPDDSWLTSEHYDEYKQQYKPKIAEVSTGKPGTGLATYVTLSGTYNDYRGTAWTVSYDVYLGKDNSQNFEVDRNSEYTNIITIKGIRNNDSYGENQVWFDHRVDVSETTDHSSYVTITRETLVDAHFEVRPLRVKLPDNIDRVLLYLPKYSDNNNQQIEETVDGEGENWIAVENNNGRVKDITVYSSNGKRKYFTTSLIKQLYLENNDETYGVRTNEIAGDEREGQKYIQLFDGDCAWIYIDENASEQMRTAEIELVFYDTDFKELDEKEVFVIKQKGLHKVGSYYVEEYEEYLHTYDSQDLYTNPLTDYTQQGLKWGLADKAISKSQYVRSTTLGQPVPGYEYDYFHSEDVRANSSYSVMDVSEVSVDMSKNIGLHFTNNAGVSQEMTIIDMNTRPSSAIQYCLSKNKFRVDESDEEAHTMDVHWYLPDVYEMTQILSDGKETFADFKANAYWTSQPSWTTSTWDTYISEDVKNARGVSLDAIASVVDGEIYQGTNFSRTAQNRIRCAYSPEGIPSVNFSGNRAPEGIGAMHFYMRAWKEWDTKEPGYFYWDWYKNIKEKKASIGEYTLEDTYAFPKVSSDDPDNVFGGYKEGYGFKKDPSNSDNWKTEIIDETLNDYTNQITLHTWPGLTTSNVVEKQTLRQVTYYTLEGTKEESTGSTVTKYREYDGDITSGGLKHLDHLLGESDLSIEFYEGDNSSYSPVYEYYKDSTITSNSTTRTWAPPTYKANIEVAKNDYSLRTPAGQVQLTDTETDDYNDKSQYIGTSYTGYMYPKSIASNDDGYIYLRQSDAIAAGNAATQATNDAGDVVTIPNNVEKEVTADPSSVLLYSYYVRTGALLSGYTYTYTPVNGTRYRYRIKYSVDGDKTSYYEYDSGGEWKYSDSESEETITTAPTIDQLSMYGGNSFKITANNGNVISSVKIYFKDSNVVDEIGTGRDYLRFTKDGWTGASGEEPPGMSYSGDGEEGTMTWNGEPQTELTFKLMLLRKTYDWTNLFGEPSSIQYINNTDDSSNGLTTTKGSKSHSIVIDQIDVRYKKKETTDSGTTE